MLMNRWPLTSRTWTFSWVATRSSGRGRDIGIHPGEKFDHVDQPVPVVVPIGVVDPVGSGPLTEGLAGILIRVGRAGSWAQRNDLRAAVGQAPLRAAERGIVSVPDGVDDGFPQFTGRETEMLTSARNVEEEAVGFRAAAAGVEGDVALRGDEAQTRDLPFAAADFARLIS